MDRDILNGVLCVTFPSFTAKEFVVVQFRRHTPDQSSLICDHYWTINAKSHLTLQFLGCFLMIFTSLSIFRSLTLFLINFILFACPHHILFFILFSLFLQVITTIITPVSLRISIYNIIDYTLRVSSPNNPLYKCCDNIFIHYITLGRYSVCVASSAVFFN